MTEPKHTPEPSIGDVAPTPWVARNGVWIHDAKDLAVCACAGEKPQRTQLRDLIIRSVNAHEGLLAALQEAYPPGSRSHDTSCPRVRHGGPESCNCREGRARAAIAAAKE